MAEGQRLNSLFLWELGDKVAEFRECIFSTKHAFREVNHAVADSLAKFEAQGLCPLKGAST